MVRRLRGAPDVLPESPRRAVIAASSRSRSASSCFTIASKFAMRGIVACGLDRDAVVLNLAPRAITISVCHLIRKAVGRPVARQSPLIYRFVLPAVHVVNGSLDLPGFFQSPNHGVDRCQNIFMTASGKSQLLQRTPYLCRH